jgi:anion-transporting  ArsA/GET3 family ATPase
MRRAAQPASSAGTTGGVLDRRLVFLVGKGGVGKSTVATALALAAVRRKKRTLLVSLDFADRRREIAGLRQAEGSEPAEVMPGLFRQNVDGRTALEEYLHLVIPVKRVLRAVFESRVYQYFVAAAPGLKELMAIGKIWYEVDRGRWDLVVVDSPATGHALQYLKMPKVAYETFTSGLVHREAKRVWELLSDPRATAVSVVTVAEELPVNEATTICRQIQGELALPTGSLYVNRFHQPRFSAADVERASSARRRGLGDACDALGDAVFRAADEELGWAALNAGYCERLAAETGWPIVLLPFLFREEFGLADVETLSHVIEEALPGVRSTRAEARP